MNKSKSSTISMRVFVAMLSLVGFTISALGQSSIGESSTKSPERGTSNPGRSFTLSDIETINNYGGDLMFNIPVGSLPPGRGGLSAGLTLNYSSKIWDVMTFDLESTVTHHDRNVLFQSNEGNWRYRYGYKLKLEAKLLGENDGFCYGNNHPWKLFIVLPDGSKHALMLDGGYTEEQGFMNILPDGRTACPNNTYPANITSTVTYFTTDGTYLRLDMLQDSDNPSSSDPEAWGNAWKNNTWVLYMPDGSLVTGNPDPTSHPEIVNRIYDRNANYLDIVELASDSSYSNHKTTSIKDQLGRKIVIEYNSATDQDSIHAPSVGGADVVTKVTWKNIQINKTYFSCDIDYPGSGGTPDLQNLPLTETMRVVDKVYLPVQLGNPSTDDMYYTFSYNADNTSATDTGWGEVSRVYLPAKAYASTEAYADYDYFYDGSTGSGVSPGDVLLNRPTQKDLVHNLKYDGTVSSQTDTWLYTPTTTYNVLANLTAVAITGPDGGIYTETYAQGDSSVSATTIPDHRKGENYKTTTTDGTVIEKYYTSNIPLNIYLASANRFVRYEFVSPKDASGNYPKTAIKEYKYDKNGNVTEVREYDFVTYSTVPRNTSGEPTGLPSGATAARITKTDYYNDTPDSHSGTYTDTDSYWFASSQRLRNLAKSMEIQDGSATPKSRSEMTYDYTSYSSNTKGGNPTETKTWDSFKGGTARSYSNPLTSTNAISTSATYNSYGMPLTSTDANGNVSQITYGNVAGPSGNVTDLYPTQTVSAYGTGVARTSSAVYDYYTGLTTSTTDEDNDVTSSMEYDDLGRPTKAITADGDALESWVVTEYHDADRFVVVKSDLETVGDGKKVATQFFDQLGRVRLSKTLEDASTQSATNETDGIKVQTRYATTYSSPNGYNYSLTSNPYRASTSSAASGEPTMGWTRSKAHHLGKHAEAETFSGSALPAPWGSSTSTTGMVQTDIDTNATTVTDQAGKLRRSITNGLGQLIRVDEPNSSNQLDTGGTPNQSTDYTYDALNNLTGVSQGAQTRTFTYSTVSRLLSAVNPESGTINYVYDSNGNLTSKTDARSIATTYSYDALNRVTARNYSDSTPDVTYTYGTTAPKIGKLTKVTNGTGADRSTTEYTGFDILGRVTAHKQTTDSVDYTTGYTYNLSGALIEETYPSGRVVKNTLDTADGSLSQVQSKRSGDTYRNYANGFIYNAAGAVTAMKLGNGKWENTVFNSRLQPTQIGLGNGVNSQNLLKLEYSYGTTANNGNVVSQTITVPGVTHPFVQSYTYDELNRVSVAEETNNSTQTWKQTFTFDRYGNRNFVTTSGATTTLPGSFDPDIYNPTISTTNNRFSSGQGYSYDNSGNTTADAEGRTFVYDAENKQIEVIESSTTIGQYFYDGDGKRVKKVVPATGETTVFVFDAAGKQIAEYSTVVQTGSNAKITYTTNDNLGSPRINTDGTGTVIARHDYHPFGEEVSRSGYGSDTIRKKFTGYERDGETGLDFAQARMFGSNLGRFTSPDPLLSSGRVENPQTWNRFAYVLGNPLNLTDPFGLYEWSEELGGSTRSEEFERELGTLRGSRKGMSKKEKKSINAKINRIKEILSRRTAFNKGMATARAAANNLAGNEKAAVNASLDAYGGEYEDNGVTVAVGEPSQNGQGLTGIENGSTIVAIRPNEFSSDTLFMTIAHEGSHILDAQREIFLNSPPTLGRSSSTLSGSDIRSNITSRETEYRAYSVSFWAAKGNNFSNSIGINGTNFYQAGWREIDAKALDQALSQIGRGPNDQAGRNPANWDVRGQWR